MPRIAEKKADQATIRRINMSAVLRLLRERGTLARADLAKELGITRNTASNIVAELLNAGVVIETEFRREGAGRPGLLLEMATNKSFSIGAEIDISRIMVVALDFKAKILWKESISISPKQSQERIIATTEQLVQSALDWGKQENMQPLGIGLGLAGLVDAQGSCLVYAPYLNWKNVPFKTMWEEKFSIPVFLDNEANAAALCYYNYTDRLNALNLAYISIGVGMAAGLVLEGHLFRGTGGFAGQAGHMKIRPDGESCRCGDQGCWSTEVGLTAFSRKTDGKPVNPDEVAQSFRFGETALENVADEMAEMLGLGIVNLINLFNLDTVILGGAMRPILPFMLKKTKEVVNRRALSQPCANVQIKVSGRDDDAVCGAACLVLDAFINDPLPLVRAES
jgi:predicted NBD/HSP70 family sugar kinase